MTIQANTLSPRVPKKESQREKLVSHGVMEHQSRLLLLAAPEPPVAAALLAQPPLPLI